jgi:hypothetical protein
MKIQLHIIAISLCLILIAGCVGDTNDPNVGNDIISDPPTVGDDTNNNVTYYTKWTYDNKPYFTRNVLNYYTKTTAPFEDCTYSPVDSSWDGPQDANSTVMVGEFVIPYHNRNRPFLTTFADGTQKYTALPLVNYVPDSEEDTDLASTHVEYDYETVSYSIEDGDAPISWEIYPSKIYSIGDFKYILILEGTITENITWEQVDDVYFNTIGTENDGVPITNLPDLWKLF